VTSAASETIAEASETIAEASGKIAEGSETIAEGSGTIAEGLIAIPDAMRTGSTRHGIEPVFDPCRLPTALLSPRAGPDPSAEASVATGEASVAIGAPVLLRPVPFRTAVAEGSVRRLVHCLAIPAGRLEIPICASLAHAACRLIRPARPRTQTSRLAVPPVFLVESSKRTARGGSSQRDFAGLSSKQAQVTALAGRSAAIPAKTTHARCRQHERPISLEGRVARAPGGIAPGPFGAGASR
jgi:hypothetical protein